MRFVHLMLLLVFCPPLWSGPLPPVALGDTLAIAGRTFGSGDDTSPTEIRGVLLLHDCTLRTSPGRAPLFRLRGPRARLQLENCLLLPDTCVVRGSSSHPSLALLDGGQLSLFNCTLIQTRDRPLLQLRQDAAARLHGCLLGRGGADAETDAILASRRSVVVFAWCMTDIGSSIAGLPAFAAGPGNRAVANLTFVKPAMEDFRLRWNSPALDAGDPRAPLDFDLTRADIGWAPTSPVVSITGVVQRPLPAAHYQVDDDAVIRMPLQPGTSLRVASGKCLRLEVDGSGPDCSLGDINGPRTAIVGRSASEAASAAAIVLSGGARAEARLNLQGVLFNYPAGDGPVHGLSIRGTRYPLDLDLSGGSLLFRNYVDVPTQGEPGSGSLNGRLLLDNCVGRLSNFSCGDRAQDGPAGLTLLNCRVDINFCNFLAVQDRNALPPLLIHGTTGGGAATLQGNTFTGSQDQDGPLLELVQTVQNLRRNRFLASRTTTLIATQSCVTMNHGARNDLMALSRGFYLANAPLLRQEGGQLDLNCGGNNLVVNGFGELWPVVGALACPGDSALPQDWSGNFWGTSCDSPILERVLNDPNMELLPPGVAATGNPWACLRDTSATPDCPVEQDESDELLRRIREAVQQQDGAAAREGCRELLMRHPGAGRTATAGTLLLKALGLDARCGPTLAGLIHDNLQAAAEASTSAGLHRQAVLQRCGAWCVAGRWTNRPAALAALAAMHELETDPICRDTFQRTLLEIATYPSGNAHTAAEVLADLRQGLTRQQAVHALLTYQRGSDLQAAEAAAPTLPLTFQITRIHPNPFNPITTIELAVPVDGHVRVTIYNLAGQRVEDLVNQELPAGLHPIRFDGSHLASGVYVVTAEQAGQTRSQKMLLLK